MLSRILKLPKNNSFFLFGPRQTGKTTWIQASFSSQEMRTYNLLITSEYMRLLENPHLFVDEVRGRPSSVKYILIDEIQRIPELLNAVHLCLESPNPPHFILSGSSARKLKRAGTNLLGGRAWTRKFFPLTHLELGDSFDLDRALRVGTLPKIYLTPEVEDSNQFLRSYVETYLKEEIEAEALVRSSGIFLRFLFQAGIESGNLINYSAISRDTGTSQPTVKEYYQILEDTLIGNFLFPFHKSERKRLATHPKFYLFDTGVTRALSKQLSTVPEPKTRAYGELFESWAINETLRLSEYFEKDFRFSFFRTEGGSEIDLIIETPKNKRIGIEFKSTANPHHTDFRAGFDAFRKIDPQIELKCVCLAPHARKGDGYEVLPWRDYFTFLLGL